MKTSLKESFQEALAKIPYSPWKKRAQFVRNFQSGLFDEVRKMVKADPALVSCTDRYGSTALHWAGSFRNEEIAEFLISKGATVDKKNYLDYTPLHYAAAHGATYVIERLVAHGADINARTREGDTPLMRAAVCIGGEDGMAALIILGADPDAVNNEGQTAFDAAGLRSDGKIAGLLKALVGLRAEADEERRRAEQEKIRRDIEKELSVITEGSQKPIGVLKPLAFKGRAPA